MADLTTELARYRKRRRYQPLVNALMLLGMASLLVLSVFIYRQLQQANAQREDAKEQRVTWVAQAKNLGEQIAASPVCESTDPAKVAEFGALCERANRVAAQADPDPADTQALTAAVTALVLASLPERLDQAVARYMQDHPQTPPLTRDEIAALIVEELAKHPPVPGLPGEKGAQGVQGPAGPPGEGVPSGCAWQNYLYPDGVTGVRCVLPN